MSSVQITKDTSVTRVATGRPSDRERSRAAESTVRHAHGKPGGRSLAELAGYSLFSGRCSVSRSFSERLFGGGWHWQHLADATGCPRSLRSCRGRVHRHFRRGRRSGRRSCFDGCGKYPPLDVCTDDRPFASTHLLLPFQPFTAVSCGTRTRAVIAF